MKRLQIKKEEEEEESPWSAGSPELLKVQVQRCFTSTETIRTIMDRGVGGWGGGGGLFL